MGKNLRENIIDIICPFAICCHTRKEYGCFTVREHWYPCVSVERTNHLQILFEYEMKEKRIKIPDTTEERTEAEVEKLLARERQLAIQNHLAPDLVDD